MPTETVPAKHIRLTSHPAEGAATAPPIHWGAPDPRERGPVVGSTTNRSQRNVIGTHSGSYGVYRALAVAAGALVKGHRPDLTNTAPTDPVGPYPAWGDPDKIVSMDPWGAVVSDVFRDWIATGLRHPADDRGHQGAHRHARGEARDRRRPAEGRRPHPARQRLGGRHQGGDRAGVVAARRRQALRRRRVRIAARAVRGNRRHVSGARHARRPRSVPAADRRADRLRVRRSEAPGRPVGDADRARARRMQRLRRVRLRHLHLPART